MYGCVYIYTWLLGLMLDKGLTELNGTVGPWERYALY